MTGSIEELNNAWAARNNIRYLESFLMALQLENPHCCGCVYVNCALICCYELSTGGAEFVLKLLEYEKILPAVIENEANFEMVFDCHMFRFGPKECVEKFFSLMQQKWQLDTVGSPEQRVVECEKFVMKSCSRMRVAALMELFSCVNICDKLIILQAVNSIMGKAPQQYISEEEAAWFHRNCDVVYVTPSLVSDTRPQELFSRRVGPSGLALEVCDQQHLSGDDPCSQMTIEQLCEHALRGASCGNFVECNQLLSVAKSKIDASTTDWRQCELLLSSYQEQTMSSEYVQFLLLLLQHQPNLEGLSSVVCQAVMYCAGLKEEGVELLMKLNFIGRFFRDVMNDEDAFEIMFGCYESTFGAPNAMRHVYELLKNKWKIFGVKGHTKDKDYGVFCRYLVFKRSLSTEFIIFVNATLNIKLFDRKIMVLSLFKHLWRYHCLIDEGRLVEIAQRIECSGFLRSDKFQKDRALFLGSAGGGELTPVETCQKGEVFDGRPVLGGTGRGRQSDKFIQEEVNGFYKILRGDENPLQRLSSISVSKEALAIVCEELDGPDDIAKIPTSKLRDVAEHCARQGNGELCQKLFSVVERRNLSERSGFRQCALLLSCYENCGMRLNYVSFLLSFLQYKPYVECGSHMIHTAVLYCLALEDQGVKMLEALNETISFFPIVINNAKAFDLVVDCYIANFGVTEAMSKIYALIKKKWERFGFDENEKRKAHERFCECFVFRHRQLEQLAPFVNKHISLQEFHLDRIMIVKFMFVRMWKHPGSIDEDALVQFTKAIQCGEFFASAEYKRGKDKFLSAERCAEEWGPDMT